jgi:hypothetical protein
MMSGEDEDNDTRNPHGGRLEGQPQELETHPEQRLHIGREHSERRACGALSHFPVHLSLYLAFIPPFREQDATGTAAV